MTALSLALLKESQKLSRALNKLDMPEDVFVYNPFDYAFEAYRLYVERFAASPLKALFLGMNPGPFGMLQTGIPFGDISKVKNFLGITSGVTPPERQHPKRPILAFDCQRGEVSGSRLWSFFEANFKSADLFFNKYFVINYCPLGFLSAGGSNVTPDKLSPGLRKEIELLCDAHLRSYVEILKPTQLVGIGAYAAKAFLRASPQTKVVTLLHPSPASPAANKGWADIAQKQMREARVL